MCLSKRVSACVCACVYGAIFCSVLGHFGVILLDDAHAQAHGEDHAEELQEVMQVVSSLFNGHIQHTIFKTKYGTI